MSAETKSKVEKKVRKKRIKITTVFSVLILGFALFASVFPGVLATHDPLALDVVNKLQGPTAAHILGTDELGRDLWSRIIWGARVSMSVGLGSATLAMLIGVPLGLVAGYRGGILTASSCVSWTPSCLSRPSCWPCC